LNGIAINAMKKNGIQNLAQDLGVLITPALVLEILVFSVLIGVNERKI
jgi:hypothetical protein